MNTIISLIHYNWSLPISPISILVRTPCGPIFYYEFPGFQSVQAPRAAVWYGVLVTNLLTTVSGELSASFAQVKREIKTVGLPVSIALNTFISTNGLRKFAFAKFLDKARKTLPT